MKFFRFWIFSACRWRTHSVNHSPSRFPSARESYRHSKSLMNYANAQLCWFRAASVRVRGARKSRQIECEWRNARALALAPFVGGHRRRASRRSVEKPGDQVVSRLRAHTHTHTTPNMSIISCGGPARRNKRCTCAPRGILVAAPASLSNTCTGRTKLSRENYFFVLFSVLNWFPNWQLYSIPNQYSL